MKKFILLVEDDRDLVESLHAFLEKHKYGVVRADSARDAIHKLKKQDFFCVITDIRLATGSGEEVIGFLRNTKNLEQNANVPIIVMSGFLDRALAQRLKNQVNGGLVKPFSKESLLEKLQMIEAGKSE